MNDLPLSEFTPGRAVIEPSETVPSLSGPDGVSEYCVLPMFGGVIRRLFAESRLVLLREIGDVLPSNWGIYKLEYQGRYVTVVHPGLGAPMAASLIEELIAMGCRKFVACGGAGVIDASLERGSVIVPTAALRDEGTSFHYLPPSRTIAVDPVVVEKLCALLEHHGVPVVTGLTWTTDGLFRETKERIAHRKHEGCITVEMECAALLAVAKYRNVIFGQYLSAWDCVGGEVWDPRHDDRDPSHEEKLFWLSVEACLVL